MSLRKDILRRCVFKPYVANAGPMFTLDMWDTGRLDPRGQSYLSYRLTMSSFEAPKTVLFEGSDFSGSPMHADDSDATVCALMAFLTLRPGDTDREFFDSYTEAQKAYCSKHAEELAAEVLSRLGES